MSVSALVAAALPIPVTAFKLIPTYKAHTSVLSVYTSLFCFLLLGFIFYSRHGLARQMFPQLQAESMAPPSNSPMALFNARLGRGFVAVAPALLICASLMCVYFYHMTLDHSLEKQLARPESEPKQAMASQSPPAANRKAEDVLNSLDSWQIPTGGQLMFFYLGIFLFAESAFILMAIKEYLQDLVKISEMELIHGYRS
jgi:hypothetical protein